MSRYEFDPDRLYDDGRKVWILDLTGPQGGCELTSGEIFDPADFGFPDWKPEPYPHPLFRDLNVPITKPTTNAPNATGATAQGSNAPENTDHTSGE